MGHFSNLRWHIVSVFTHPFVANVVMNILVAESIGDQILHNSIRLKIRVFIFLQKQFLHISGNIMKINSTKLS